MERNFPNILGQPWDNLTDNYTTTSSTSGSYVNPQDILDTLPHKITTTTAETFPWDMLETDGVTTTDDFYDNDDVDDFYSTLPHKWDTTTTKATEKLVSSLFLDKSFVTVNVGENFTLYATYYPSDAVPPTITWQSSNSTVASVGQNGYVTVKNSGKARITATTDNGLSAYCDVTVKNPVKSIKFAEKEITIGVGDFTPIKCTIDPVNADDRTLTWASSDTSAVSVDANGTVKGIKGGTSATITATAVNGVSASIVVKVEAAKPESVSLNASEKTLCIGDTFTLIATIKPSEAANDELTWMSGNSAVATVSDGVVTAVGTGTATITVKTSNGLKAECKVTVKKLEATGVTVSPSKADVKIGELLSLSAKVTPDKAEQKVTWTSSDTSIATVSRNGVIKGIKVGTVTITAKTANGKTASCKVTVKPIEVSSISLNVTSKELEQGKTLALYATVNPANATVKTVTWSSSNTSVATVDANGKVTAKSKGTATITATSNNGKTATCKITVPEVAVTGITLNKTSVSLNVGDTESLSATITPSNAGNKSVTWSVDNKSVATVDSNGNVKAVGEGKTIVTAKTANGKTAACTITVVDLSNYVFQFLPDNRHIQYVEVGETKQLSFAPIPVGVNVKFKSADESIVTVDSNGYITGKKFGSSTIIVTVNGKTTIGFVQVTANKEMVYAARKQFAEEILYYVNIERKKEGLAPVQLMDDLSYLAQIRTDEQVKEYREHKEKYTSVPPIPFISHTRPDGTDWGTVFEYAPNLKSKAKAENLIQWAGISAENCVKRWMESPGHRANILRHNMTHMGIGVVFTIIDPDGTSYALCVTQLFIQQRSSK